MDFYDFVAWHIAKTFDGEFEGTAVLLNFENPVCTMKIVIPPIIHNNKLTVDLWGRLFLYKNLERDDVAQHQDVIAEVFNDSGFEETFTDPSDNSVIDLFSMSSQQALDVSDIKRDIEYLNDRDMKEYLNTSPNVKKFIESIKEDVAVFRKLSADAVDRIKKEIDG